MKKQARQVSRNPLVMIIAGVMWLAGFAIAAVVLLNFDAFGWAAIPLIAGGVSSIYFASMTIITGKPEWILLDLVLPG